MPDPLLLIVAALTPTERGEIMRRFTEANPGWHGSDVGAVLAELDDRDDSVERIHEFLRSRPEMAIPGSDAAALALIWSGQELDSWALLGLLTRANLMEG